MDNVPPNLPWRKSLGIDGSSLGRREGAYTVDKLRILPKPLSVAHGPEHPKPGVQREKPIPIEGLNIVARQTPPVLLGPLHETGAYRIEVNVSKAVYERVAVVENHAFEPLPRKKPFGRLLVVPQRRSSRDVADHVLQWPRGSRRTCLGMRYLHHSSPLVAQ